ncbi:hypothetical protein MPSEU_000852500 [Mayamaea pseudoterrestris]|nr:hypothetical protein MPSEU_000852500 [Mayamaea pseudoterrestris]
MAPGTPTPPRPPVQMTEDQRMLLQAAEFQRSEMINRVERERRAKLTQAERDAEDEIRQLYNEQQQRMKIAAQLKAKQEQQAAIDDAVRQAMEEAARDRQRAVDEAIAKHMDSEIAKEMLRQHRAPVQVYTPNKPIMGTVVQISTKERAACMGGGPPNVDWSGLEKPVADGAKPSNSLMLRPLNDSKQQERQKGLPMKFTLTCNLQHQQMLFKEQAELCGNDTYCYVIDPRDPTKTKLVNFLQYYSLFESIESVKEAIAPFVASYDEYDRGNDKDLIRFFKNSCNEELRTRLDHYTSASAQDSFCVVYFQVMEMILHQSRDWYLKVEQEVAAYKPQAEPGQNITTYMDALIIKAKPLINAGQYPHSLTTKVLKNLLQAGGERCLENTGGEEFIDEMKAWKAKHVIGLKACSNMTPTDQDAYMTREHLTLKDLAQVANTAYRQIHAANDWVPAKNPRDKTAIPPTFGGVVQLDKAKANGRGAKEEKTCHICHKPGHFQRDCPQATTVKTSNKRGAPKGNGKGKPKTAPKSGKGASSKAIDDVHHYHAPWRRIAPSASQPSTIEKGGKTYHWCAHCNKWQLNHGTDEHTGSKSAPAAAPNGGHLAWFDTPAAYLAIEDPSACAQAAADAKALALANDDCSLEEGEEAVIDAIASAMVDGEDAIASIVADDPMIIDEHTPAAIVAKLCNIERSPSDDRYESDVQFARNAAIQARELASGVNAPPAKIAKLNPAAPAWTPPLSPSSEPSAKRPTKPNKSLSKCTFICAYDWIDLLGEFVLSSSIG